MFLCQKINYSLAIRIKFKSLISKRNNKIKSLIFIRLGFLLGFVRMFICFRYNYLIALNTTAYLPVSLIWKTFPPPIFCSLIKSCAAALFSNGANP